MYHTTSVFPEKISFEVELENEHPVIINLADEDDSTNVIRIFLTKEKAKELFLELGIALEEFDEEQKEESTS